MVKKYLICVIIATLVEITLGGKPCKVDLYPIYVGGRAQETVSNCIVYDKAYNYIIVGGTAIDVQVTGE